MKQKAYEVIDENQENMLALWEKLVNIESGPGCKEGVDEVGSILADFFASIDGKNRFHKFSDAGNMLISEFGDCSKPFIILTGHNGYCFQRRYCR